MCSLLDALIASGLLVLSGNGLRFFRQETSKAHVILVFNTRSCTHILGVLGLVCIILLTHDYIKYKHNKMQVPMIFKNHEFFSAQRMIMNKLCPVSLKEQAFLIPH